MTRRPRRHPRPTPPARSQGPRSPPPRRPPRPTRPSKRLTSPLSEGPAFVGLTGGIGAGKSEALAALARLGASVLSTDTVVHELYADPEVRDAVVERWGPHVAPAGRIDRAAVAPRAFASVEDREWLERLLWPRVRAKMAEWRRTESARDPAPRALVVEVPLLFESGLDAAFDATLVVVAEEEARRRRAGARGHAALDERSARQLSQDEKAARATYTVANSGTIQELEQALSHVLEKLNE